MEQTHSPIACRLDRLTETERAREGLLLQLIREATLEIQELPMGCALRLPNDSAVLLQIAEFISLERLCCPFFHFEVQIEPDAGPVWLRLTGRQGVKQFLADVLKLGSQIVGHQFTDG